MHASAAYIPHTAQENCAVDTTPDVFAIYREIKKTLSRIPLKKPPLPNNGRLIERVLTRLASFPGNK